MKEIKKEINKKVKSILDLVLEINNKEGYDSFFSYAGHVNSIEVRVQESHDYCKDEEYITYIEDRVYLNNDFCGIKDNRLERLNDLQKRLSDFLNKINKENK